MLCFNPYFIGLPILIGSIMYLTEQNSTTSFNPYFIGLPILILKELRSSQVFIIKCFNPYFIGLPILIGSEFNVYVSAYVVSILILLDYLFLC